MRSHRDITLIALGILFVSIYLLTLFSADPPGPEPRPSNKTVAKGVPRPEPLPAPEPETPTTTEAETEPEPETLTEPEPETNTEPSESPADLRAHSLERLIATRFVGSDTGASTTPRALSTWKRSRIVPNTSTLQVGESETLPLEGVQIHAAVDGTRARVLLDLHFYNDHDWALEGTFKLRLPDGASPYYLAFGQNVIDESRPAPTSAELTQLKDPAFMLAAADSRNLDFRAETVLSAREKLWSNPREARMGSRDKAAHAFRETVRKAVDPALLEWSGSNIFSANLFPIEAQKSHRVVIGYELDLLRLGDDYTFTLDLPPDTPTTWVHLAVSDIDNSQITTTPSAVPYHSFGKSHFRFQNPEAPQITVTLRNPGTTLLTGNDPTGSYFHTRFTPQLEAPQAPANPNALFLLDTSLSANPDAFNVQLALLERILERNRDELTHFNVLFFSVDAHWYQPTPIPNTAENTATLLAHARTLALEGATDLDLALREATLQAQTLSSAPDLFLLSDGGITWGEDNLHALSARLDTAHTAGLFAYRTGIAGGSTRTLAALAQAHGGALFSVVGEAELDAASTAHRKRPFTLLEASLDGTSDLLLAGQPHTLFPGQELTLVGRGTPAEDAPVRLVLERAGERTTLDIPIAHRLPSVLAPRAFGVVATAQLEALGWAAEDDAAAYARHFRVPGKTASLVMLENAWDYDDYNLRSDGDGEAVAQTSASHIVTDTLRAVGDSLSNPKAAFLAWLQRMESAPGVDFVLTHELRETVEAMPRDTFDVHVRPLASTLRNTDNFSENHLLNLLENEIDQDLVYAEAARRLEENTPADALKALSSLVERSPGSGVIARDVGYMALQWGIPEQAFHLFRRQLIARPYQPHNLHAMALALVELGQTDLALAYFEVGLSAEWDRRFGDVHDIMALDHEALLRRIDAGELATSVPTFAASRLAQVSTSEKSNPRSDLVVTITWNTDNTDIDLHVVEPTGEVCNYTNRNTKIGGRLTRDVTQGFGPEMYVLEHAKAGDYEVKVKLYSNDSNRLSTRTKVLVTLHEGWGTPHAKTTRKVVVLQDTSELQTIETVTLAGKS